MTIQPAQRAELVERKNSSQETSTTMKESKFITKDSVCGMTVDKATALR